MQDIVKPSSLKDSAKAETSPANGDCRPAPCLALWHCNKCGREFTEDEASSVEVSADCDECVIACPDCWANVIDEWDSLTSPNAEFSRLRDNT